MKIFRFFDFPVYQDSVKFYIEFFELLKSIKDLTIKDQGNRAGISILFNITEGSAMKSDKEISRYLEKSLGSTNEVAACLHLMFKRSLISKEKFEYFLGKAESIAKQLGGFKKSLQY